jgi:hypothetical protein
MNEFLGIVVFATLVNRFVEVIAKPIINSIAGESRWPEHTRFGVQKAVSVLAAIILLAILSATEMRVVVLSRAFPNAPQWLEVLIIASAIAFVGEVLHEVVSFLRDLRVLVNKGSGAVGRSVPEQK